MFYALLTEVFVFGCLKLLFLWIQAAIPPFYWPRIRVGHPCQGPVAKPLNIKGTANILYPLSQFNTGTPNIEWKAWGLDSVEFPLLTDSKKTRIRNCGGVDSTSLLCTQTIAHIQKRKHLHPSTKPPSPSGSFFSEYSKVFVRYDSSSFKQKSVQH